MIPAARCNIAASGRLSRILLGVVSLGASLWLMLIRPSIAPALVFLAAGLLVFLGVLAVLEGLSGFCVVNNFLERVDDSAFEELAKLGITPDRSRDRTYTALLVGIALLVSVIVVVALRLL